MKICINESDSGSFFIMKNKKLSFDDTVFAALKQIPRGRVVTYKIIAQAIGRPRSARAVGQAVGRNPNAPKVPCHRVIYNDGRLGGYSGFGGKPTKIRLLEQEGIAINRGRVENFQKFLYNFKA
jgi:methylated-DNA-[protein]-cysteine S-methyltransferase